MLLRKYDNYLDSQNKFIDISFYGKDKLLHGLTAWPDNNRLLRKLLYKIPFLRPYSFQHKEEFSVSHCGKNSLFHTVGYKNHSAGYIFHSVGYKSRTVKQRICKSVLKNVTGYAELINRAERIIV